MTTTSLPSGEVDRHLRLMRLTTIVVAISRRSRWPCRAFSPAISTTADGKDRIGIALRLKR